MSRAWEIWEGNPSSSSFKNKQTKGKKPQTNPISGSWARLSVGTGSQPYFSCTPPDAERPQKPQTHLRFRFWALSWNFWGPGIFGDPSQNFWGPEWDLIFPPLQLLNGPQKTPNQSGFPGI